MGLTQVNTDGVKDDAVTLAKQAAGTDGQVITYDASGNPVAVGPGTDGQVLTSTGAGSPPAFENLPTSGPTLTGSTDNTICTVTGANAIQGEANLTFDGTSLGVNQSSFATTDTVFSVTKSDAHCETGIISKNDSAAIINLGDTDSYNQGRIKYNNADNSLTFRTSGTDKLSISTGGNVTISDGDLVIGTAGHGIDFSATGDESGMTGELLDDYEEGTWTPIHRNGVESPAYTTQQGYYTKVGHLVTATFNLTWGSCDGNGGHLMLGNLPYTPASSPHDDRGNGVLVWQNINGGEEQVTTVYLSGVRMDLYKKGSVAFTTTNGTGLNGTALSGGVTYRAA
jgi:hypothetical protein